MPEAASKAPSDNRHAPKAGRPLSECSPRAAGRTQNATKIATEPTAIIQLPTRDDMFLSFGQSGRIRSPRKPGELTAVDTPNISGFSLQLQMTKVTLVGAECNFGPGGL